MHISDVVCLHACAGCSPPLSPVRWIPLTVFERQIVYAADVYSESPLPKSKFSANKKHFKDQLHADVDALSSHSSDPEVCDEAAKTPKEIATWLLVAKRSRMGIAGIL